MRMINKDANGFVDIFVANNQNKITYVTEKGKKDQPKYESIHKICTFQRDAIDSFKYCEYFVYMCVGDNVLRFIQ